MKLHVLGVKRLSGTSKAGNQFDMATLVGLTPVDTGARGSIRVEGFGFDVAEIQVAPEAVQQFSGIKFPAMLELETEARPYMGKFETTVVGVKSQSASKIGAVG